MSDDYIPEGSYVDSYATVVAKVTGRLIAALVEKGVFTEREAREIVTPPPPPYVPREEPCCMCGAATSNILQANGISYICRPCDNQRRIVEMR